MNDTEMELCIGDTVQVGDVSVTILDVDGDSIRFRIDSPQEEPESSVRLDMKRWLPPR